MGHADDPHPGVARRVAVGRELFEMGDVRRCGRGRVVCAQPGLLGQFTRRRRAKILVTLDETAGQRPAPLEGSLTAPHDQRAQGVAAHGEHDQVDGDCERGVSRRVVGRHAGDLSRLPDDKQAFPSGPPTSSRHLRRGRGRAAAPALTCRSSYRAAHFGRRPVRVSPLGRDGVLVTARSWGSPS